MKKVYSIFVSLFILSAIVCAQPTSQTFNISGSYTVPVGYSAIVTIEAWGAGASGGTGNGAFGGGGGGAYASISTTLASGSYTVTVGTGGNNTGQNGTSSSFTTIVVAAGGSTTTTGTGGAGGTVAASTGTTRIAGIAGSNSSGNDGGAGGAGANGGGAGGTGGLANNGVGGNGVAPGGGGGGNAGPGNSGTGAGVGGNGRVVVTVSSVLPVKLSNIKAFEKQSGIQIEWTAFGEENLYKYQIERSADGVLFTSVGELTAHNQSTSVNYVFFDGRPIQGISFYRLRTIDIDSKFGFSSIIKVNLEKGNKEITVYPNPVTSGIVSVQSADLSKGNYSVNIFNAAGQQIYSQRVTHTGGSLNQTIELPVSVKSGMYTMQLNNEGVKVMSKTFMVQ